MSFTMTRQECQNFLAGVHVGVVSVTEEGRGPLAVPVWYIYDPGGEVWFCTWKKSRKAMLIQRAGRFSMCAQKEEPPYKYVTVEGPVTACEEEDIEAHSRPLARRYLGLEGGDRYVTGLLNDPAYGEGVVIRMRPERWYSGDFSE
jgi:nitroimidazol reductase NimA-like FMN-containing flavoprotein (pyridoxamine 5'-phosphate oxidase superfamily)